MRGRTSGVVLLGALSCACGDAPLWLSPPPGADGFQSVLRVDASRLSWEAAGLDWSLRVEGTRPPILAFYREPLDALGVQAGLHPGPSSTHCARIEPLAVAQLIDGDPPGWTEASLDEAVRAELVDLDTCGPCRVAVEARREAMSSGVTVAAKLDAEHAVIELADRTHLLGDESGWTEVDCPIPFKANTIAPGRPGRLWAGGTGGQIAELAWRGDGCQVLTATAADAGGGVQWIAAPRVTAEPVMVLTEKGEIFAYQDGAFGVAGQLPLRATELERGSRAGGLVALEGGGFAATLEGSTVWWWHGGEAQLELLPSVEITGATTSSLFDLPGVGLVLGGTQGRLWINVERKPGDWRFQEGVNAPGELSGVVAWADGFLIFHESGFVGRWRADTGVCANTLQLEGVHPRDQERDPMRIGQAILLPTLHARTGPAVSWLTPTHVEDLE